MPTSFSSAKNRCQKTVRRVSFANGMNRKLLLCAVAGFFLATRGIALAESSSAAKSPPPPVRELRGAWIATVANINRPSKPGLSVAQQQAELISLLDHAARLHLNAIYFQVRPVADALYASPLEPWSEYLTGTQGKMPQPLYDPLALAVSEAHQRGLQLHAWFNPFRAGHPDAKSSPALNHVIRTHPELVRHYGKQIWLDPGEPEARARAINAVLDVVNRYDVDGVVFDDYFYPYPEKVGGVAADFPDGASWKKYGAQSGLSRDDWRRENINRFVQKVSQSVHAAKPWVQFGISPFGIWRPGVPTGIDTKALDAYGKLYADAKLWINNGWVDYLAPQLYWPIAPSEHSFTTLNQWWRQQNLKGRHVFAGLYDAAAGSKFSEEEIGRQMDVVRAQTGSGGVIHYHLGSLIANPRLAKIVAAKYAPPALPPAVTWLESTPPKKPKLQLTESRAGTKFQWENSGETPPRWWLLQFFINGVWTTEVLPTGETARTFSKDKPEMVCLRAVDRLGNLSEPASWTPKKYSPADTTKGATRIQQNFPAPRPR